MREIKFRGLGLERYKFYSGYLIEDLEGFNISFLRNGDIYSRHVFHIPNLIF